MECPVCLESIYSFQSSNYCINHHQIHVHCYEQMNHFRPNSPCPLCRQPYNFTVPSNFAKQIFVIFVFLSLFLYSCCFILFVFLMHISYFTMHLHMRIVVANLLIFVLKCLEKIRKIFERGAYLENDYVVWYLICCDTVKVMEKISCCLTMSFLMQLVLSFIFKHIAVIEA